MHKVRCSSVSKANVLSGLGVLVLGLLGCGGSDHSEKQTTEWFKDAGSGEPRVAGAALTQPAESESSGQPQTGSGAGSGSRFERPVFHADQGGAEVDTERLKSLQTQYDSDVAGVTYESSPTDVSRAFVDLLHQDDVLVAERLLTLRARAVIHESGLELGPIAGAQAQYVIGEARYATNEKSRAYVDCFVFDPELSSVGQGGQEPSFKVTWVLRQESIYGWRVCGMVSEEDGQPRMVHFENPEHALAINQMYDEGFLDDGVGTKQAVEANPGTIR